MEYKRFPKSGIFHCGALLNSGRRSNSLWIKENCFSKDIVVKRKNILKNVFARIFAAILDFLTG